METSYGKRIIPVNPQKRLEMEKQKMKKKRWGREAWLFLYLPVYLILFYTVEQLVTDSYWVSYCSLDDLIPFVPQLIALYVMWYPLMLGMAVWLFVKDKPAFVRFGASVALGLSASLLIFVIFPNGQNLRPASVPGTDIFSRLVRAIYAADTNTNVLPSMHVVGTMAAIFAAFDSKCVRNWARWGVTLLGVSINLSTVFVKQHSVLDILAGIVLAGIVYFAVYPLSAKLERKREKRSEV